MLRKLSDLIADVNNTVSSQDIKGGESLTNDLGCDSLHLVDLSIRIDEEFGVMIYEYELASMSVDDVLSRIK